MERSSRRNRAGCRPVYQRLPQPPAQPLRLRQPPPPRTRLMTSSNTTAPSVALTIGNFLSPAHTALMTNGRNVKKFWPPWLMPWQMNKP